MNTLKTVWKHMKRTDAALGKAIDFNGPVYKAFGLIAKLFGIVAFVGVGLIVLLYVTAPKPGLSREQVRIMTLNDSYEACQYQRAGIPLSELLARSDKTLSRYHNAEKIKGKYTSLMTSVYDYATRYPTITCEQIRTFLDQNMER